MKEIKRSIILFAGTTEGRLLAEYLQELNRPFVICVATGYGRDLLEDICRPDHDGCMEIRQGRLNVTEMERMFDKLRPELVIDATHPYAVEVTRNIRIACSKRKGLRLIRCLREPGAGDSRPGVIHMPDVEAAVTWLSSVTGNILVTKDGGAAGGFSEKIKAAHRAGAAAVVIDRPGSGEGISLDEIKGQLKEWMEHEKKGSIYG